LTVKNSRTCHHTTDTLCVLGAQLDLSTGCLPTYIYVLAASELLRCILASCLPMQSVSCELTDAYIPITKRERYPTLVPYYRVLLACSAMCLTACWRALRGDNLPMKQKSPSASSCSGHGPCPCPKHEKPSISPWCLLNPRLAFEIFLSVNSPKMPH